MDIEKENINKTEASLSNHPLQSEVSEKEGFTLEDYKDIFESLGKEIMVSATDAKGNIIYANEKFLEASRYSRNELIGQNHRILKSGYQSSEFYNDLWKTISSGRVWRGEVKNRAKDGSYYWVDIAIAPLLGSDGKPKKYVSALFLITEQKSMQSIQRESQYARSLIEASLDPLVTISPEGKITDVNEALIKVTGMPREKLIGTDFSDYFTEPKKASEGYLQVFAKGAVADYPLTIRHKDGRLTDVLYNATVYKDAQDNVMGVFAAARDVTAQKKAEKELAEQRNKDLQRLAELEKFQKITVGRELRMIELKKDIEDLKAENAALKQKST